LILGEGPETVAAFWADPVQGNAGALPPPKGYFEKVQAVLRKYDILFVADEVICGFGRTGNMWGCQTYDLRPDMIACAKGLSAAMQPISALMINERVFEVLKEESNRNGAFVHGYAYAGHPVAAAVALETIKIYEEMDIVSVVKAREGAFQEMLRELASHPIVGSASGCGLIGGLELVRDKEAHASFPKEAGLLGKIDQHAQRHGIILRVVPDRIAFSPSLIASDDDLREIGQRTRRVLDAVLVDVKDFVA
jgi:4-aminobutyrate--pyruvate transaminase